MEEWKTIPFEELDGRYQISTYGRIKRIARDVNFIDGRCIHLEEKILTPHLSPKGYIIINLATLNGHSTYKLHRLVAMTFIPNPHDLPEVNHKDENKANNHIDNLEWCTHQYNSSYGTRGVRQGAKMACLLRGRKLSEETKTKISMAHKGLKHTDEWKKNHAKKIKQIAELKKSLGIPFSEKLPDELRTLI